VLVVTIGRKRTSTAGNEPAPRESDALLSQRN